VGVLAENLWLRPAGDDSPKQRTLFPEPPRTPSPSLPISVPRRDADHFGPSSVLDASLVKRALAVDTFHPLARRILEQIRRDLGKAVDRLEE
jgi:hypothetical protein